MFVNMENPTTGEIRQCKVGFSWTMLFFGFWVPVFRSDWKWAIFTLLLSCCTFDITEIILPFLYNKIYLKDLLENGWQPVNYEDRQILRQKGLYFK